MAREPIPGDVRRFIPTSITSVPYLEAMLLLRNEPQQSWDSQRVAQRLYISEKAATELLSEWCCRRFRWRACRCGFNEPPETPTNRLQHPTDVVCLMVF